MTPLRKAGMTIASLSLVAAACGGDGGDGDAAQDDDSTVVIATTTVAPSPATTDEPDTPPSTDAEADDDTAEQEPDTITTSPPVTVETETTPPPTDPPTTPPTTTEPPPVVGNPSVATERIGGFDQPIDLAVRPGDDAIYIVEQGGDVVRVVGDESIEVADISERISDGGEQGLLGLEFSPDGSLAYVNYTDLFGTTVIAEYPVGDGGTIDVGSERVVMTVPQPFGNHNAGDLAFGPDGYLYITMGDGGSGGDPDRYASDPQSLLGSLLRIDPTPSADAPYTIPPDNPFATGEFDGVPGRPETWAWGLRNPWKIAFDPITGELWIPDVGQNEVEEVNVVGPVGDTPAGRGADFGWSAFEGANRFNTDVAERSQMLFPVLTYQHGSDGCSVSGGVPYRGSAIPELSPAFVYSDFCSGILWALDLAGGRNLTLLTGFSSVAAVRAGPDGELYVLERGGSVYRLIAG